MRRTEVALIRLALAIDRVLQWVASRGSSFQSLDDHRLDGIVTDSAGSPARGSPRSPARPLLAKRERHWPTVFSLTRSWLAMPELVIPLALSRMIWARKLNSPALVDGLTLECGQLFGRNGEHSFRSAASHLKGPRKDHRRLATLPLISGEGH